MKPSVPSMSFMMAAWKKRPASRRAGSCGQPPMGTYTASIRRTPHHGAGMFDAHLVVGLADVGEAGGLHALALQAVLEHGEGASDGGAALEEDGAPLLHGALVLDGAVVGADDGRGLMALDPAAGLEGAVGLGVQGVPVDDAADEEAHVDVVEAVLLEGPRLGAVVDLAARSGVGQSQGRLEGFTGVGLTTAGSEAPSWAGWARGRCR